MFGSLVGDICASPYELIPQKTKDIDLFNEAACFTDDTALTIAVADYLMNGGSLVSRFHDMFEKFPGVGWGQTFGRWARVRDPDPYQSWGNGGAMRVAPVAWFFDDMVDVLKVAEETCAVTHNHPDGIAGAKAVAAAIFMARSGASKNEIKGYIENEIGYDLSRSLDSIRPDYQFQVYAIWSVPESIICFLESVDFEDSIRNAISLGGDADTQACICGGIAEAFYRKLPGELVEFSLKRLEVGLYKNAILFYDTHVLPKLSTSNSL